MEFWEFLDLFMFWLYFGSVIFSIIINVPAPDTIFLIGISYLLLRQVEKSHQMCNKEEGKNT